MIRESYNEEGEDHTLLDEIVDKIKDRISKINVFNEKYILHNLNGQFHLAIMANHNHRSDLIIELFKWIASISNGSYGLLYIQDDEDIARNNENKFKVWRMKKGIVDEIDDLFLSPRIPIIEE